MRLAAYDIHIVIHRLKHRTVDSDNAELTAERRQTTRRARLADYLPEIEAALEAAGQTPTWLRRRNRAAPFSGRAPVVLMAEQPGEGAAEVLQFLKSGGAAQVAGLIRLATRPAQERAGGHVGRYARFLPVDAVARTSAR